jgi:glycine oxidase
MKRTCDVLVLGAGISGLSAARELARRALRVVVVERDEPGAHASSAAAGILAARGVVRSDVAGRMFYTRSLDAYADWIARLASESGLAVPLRTGDDWCLFPPGGRADRFRQRLERESDPSRWEESDRIPTGLAGIVADRPWRIFRFADERWCDPSDLMAALLESVRRSGVEVLARVGVPSLERGAAGWKADADGIAIEAPVALVAAGPWSGRILSGLGWTANLVPVRGQLALVPRLHGLEAMVHLEDTFYAVPRGDRSLVGATIEHGQWDESTTPRGLAELESRMRELFPRVDISLAERAWAGIRPRTRDRVPHLGWLEPGRLLVASGHYRSGISMAARNGEVVADLVQGRALPDDIASLSPLRGGGGYRKTQPERRTP